MRINRYRTVLKFAMIKKNLLIVNSQSFFVTHSQTSHPSNEKNNYMTHTNIEQTYSYLTNLLSA